MNNFDNPIFFNKLFIADLYKYNLFGTLLKRKKFEIDTDNINYAIFSFEDGTVWLWTIDNISEEILNKIIKNIPDNGEIIYKDNISYFIENQINAFNKEKFGCYYCKETIEPKKKINLSLEKANEFDKEQLIQLWMRNCAEANYEITYEEASIYISRWLKDGNFYFYKNNNSIICFANYQIIDNYARVEHAYTVDDKDLNDNYIYRGKGYMANLIYEITNDILKKGYIPILQTDINYVPSNKSYQNVGYKLDNVLVKCNYEKKYIKIM